MFGLCTLLSTDVLVLCVDQHFNQLVFTKSLLLICSQDMVGPVNMGATQSIGDIYKLFASLCSLRQWITDVFASSLEEWLSEAVPKGLD